MKLIDYIRGDRRGREANSFEQEAMDDPFLSDAIEGYDSVYGDHLDIVKRLENWVDDHSVRRKQARKRLIWGVSIAAAVVLIGGGIAFFNYAGFRPSEHTVAELLTEENPKTYISEPEFYSEIEPAGTLIAAAYKGKEVSGGNAIDGDSASVASAATATHKPLILAAHTASPAGVQASATTEESMSGEYAAVISAAKESAGSAQETRVSSAEDIQAAERENTAEKSVIKSTEDTLFSGGLTGSAESSRQVAVTRAYTTPEEALDTVYNASFTKYFFENRRPKTDAQGNAQSGTITIEFRVNTAGVPSAIRVLSSFSREANREVIEMLVEGPRWEPTQDRRIRTIVEY